MTSRLLRISSKNRAGNSVSKYDIVYNTNDRELHSIKRVALKSATIPNTQYNIDSNNNTLYMTNSFAAGPSFVITPGQYTTTTLITALVAAVGGTFGIAQDAITQKLTLSVTGPATIDIISDTATNPMATVLGLTTDDAATSSHTAASLPDIRGLTNIYIASRTLSNGGNQMSSNEKNTTNVFCNVPVTAVFGGTVNLEEDENTLDYVLFNSHKNISSIDIRLMDEDNNTLELNGFEWTLVFRIYS